MNKILYPLFVLFLLVVANTFAQSLPFHMHFSDDGRRLITGKVASTGLYEEDIIRRFDLTFDQPNYWTQLTNNYISKTDIPATLTVEGVSYKNVGVRFKGQTSYSRSGNTQKKSFNLSIDFVDPDQEVMGYNTLNLNNSFDDPSFMREVLYLHINRRHIPAAMANYVHLFINGQSWGIYPNIQQINGDLLEEWFLSNDGTRWRAERVGGPGGPGMNNPFGAGTSSLNFLGADTALYLPHYTLKTAKKEQPWNELVTACATLNNPPLNLLEDSLKKVFDTDRALWFIAHEIIFGDDDGYVNKGGMDYYVYWDKETNRVVPIEYDGNSVMSGMTGTWSPFLKENDAKYPLMNRLFKVPALRQRYLAHVRTIIEEDLDPAFYEPLIDHYYQMIDSLVNADPKKIYTYSQFVSGRAALKTYLMNRRTFLLNNAEVRRTGPDISNVIYSSQNGDFEAPQPEENVWVRAKVSAAQGIQKVYLYFATGLDGYFEKMEMSDDGAHADDQAGDGIFGAALSGYPAGTYVRYYIEAVANDGFGTVSYMPQGAEHDVYVYQVKSATSSTAEIVINELMASNSMTQADQDGEYDDWIELYNKSGVDVDLSGWHLTDKTDRLDKWTFPNGTYIPAYGYLIVWADENGSQAGLHANFKLSAEGEVVILSDSTLTQIDRVDFGQQETDMGYARVPNGTGAFVIQQPTFQASNDITAVEDKSIVDTDFLIYPNPVYQVLHIAVNTPIKLHARIFNVYGQAILTKEFTENTSFDVSEWQPGIYCVQVGNITKKVVIR